MRAESASFIMGRKPVVDNKAEVSLQNVLTEPDKNAPEESDRDWPDIVHSMRAAVLPAIPPFPTSIETMDTDGAVFEVRTVEDCENSILLEESWGIPENKMGGPPEPSYLVNTNWLSEVKTEMEFREPILSK